MTEAKHTALPTPGPYHVNGFNMSQVVAIHAGPDVDGHTYIDGRHQHVICDARGNTAAEAIANAAMIKAALVERPELLAVREAAMNLAVQAHAAVVQMRLSSCRTIDDSDCKELERAIAKFEVILRPVAPKAQGDQ